MKKLSVLFLSVLIVFVSFSTVSAETSYEVDLDENERMPTESFGVSTEVPGDPVEEEEGQIRPFGIYKPGSTHDIYMNGRMDFAGVASGSILYTNKNFKGYSSYKMRINNRSSSTLTVKIHKNTTFLDPVVKTYTVSPNSTRYAYPGGLDANQIYFISFSAPSNFNGYIEY